MRFSLFSREKDKAQAADSGDSIYNAFMEGLTDMERQGVGRVVLTAGKVEPDKNATGRWLEYQKDTRYYPFEMLQKAERNLILKGESYLVNALVTKNVGDIRTYPSPGLEYWHRTRVHPMLPKIIPESEFNYVTKLGNVLSGEELKSFAHQAGKNGWSAEDIQRSVRDGIVEWEQITRELKKNPGLYGVLSE
ncbi:hypothetical protein HY212_05010 [Candidatus Pacearchaeota archaeon]|nr:hypothetical protein [Candidatus Pacearchaeota archaeon]